MAAPWLRPPTFAALLAPVLQPYLALTSDSLGAVGAETPGSTCSVTVQVDKCALTVCRQVVDQQGQEGDEHAGDDDVDHVEQRFASDHQVEGDVLVLVALHGNVFVGVSLGRSVDDLPLTILCGPRNKPSLDRKSTFSPPL